MYLAYDLGFHIILCSSVFSGLAVDTCLPRQLATERAGHGTVGYGRQTAETLGIRGMSEDDGRRRRTATEDRRRLRRRATADRMEVRSFYGFAYVYILRNYLFRDFRHFGNAVVW